MAELDPGIALDRLWELSRRMLSASDLDARLTVALASLAELFDVRHTMLFVPAGDDGLTTIASHGYPPGGVGASVSIGQGLVGTAAERKRTLRVTNLQRGLNMVRAIHQSPAPSQTRDIPFMGIVNSQSQLAVPLMIGDQLLGVLYAEDTRPGAYGLRHEQVVEIVAHELARDLSSESEATIQHDTSVAAPGGASPLQVQYYQADSSVFFDGEYVIKSLPGSILHRLLHDYVERGRADFTLKELRLDPELQNHIGRDNLDARLILLTRRLQERFPFVRITRTGRGRFHLEMDRTAVLQKA
jgi:signal transduction protein with GAF and PtsI domain